MKRDFSDGFIEIARDYLKLVRGELQPYTSEDIQVVINDKNTATIFAPKHIHFAKYGRGPGKQPPIDPLIKWVKKKGLVSSDSEARGTAFAIAKSIAKKGTKNYNPSAPDAIEEALDKGFKQYGEELLEFTTKRTLEELQLIYEELFPERIKL